MEHTIRHTTIRIVQGDIADQSADALVNAASNHLWMGAGVAGALKERGGRIVEDEAMAQAPIAVGDAVVTTAGALNAKAVIHAAAMTPGMPATGASIAQATRSSLRLADEHHFRTIAFPALGTGVGAFPIAEAAQVMMDAVADYVAQGTRLQLVTFVLYDREAHDAFADRLAGLAHL